MLTLLVCAGGAFLFYFCVQVLNIPLEDVLDNVGAPIPSATGLFALYRYYETIIKRITYIGVLIYWYVTVAHPSYGNSQIFTTILMELMRRAKDGHGPTDEFGRHWTLNIAETFSLLAFGIVTEKYWEKHYWTMTLLTVFLTLFIFGHHVFQLWMQKQIARLTRYNRHAWTWRDLIIEYSLQRITRKLNTPLSRAIIHIWWSGWFWFYKYMTNKRISQVATRLFFLRLFYRSSLLSYGTRCVFMYSVWIKEFAKFSNPDPPPYKYEALKKSDHIRILLLHPTFGFRPISCNLIQGPHMRRLFYEAISYTWGSGELTQQIMVDGCTMKVTESVHEILSSYSSLLVPRLLWIDALCINQENTQEKALQVPLMQRIYQNALFTTVFLGRAPTDYGRVAHHSSIIMPYRYDGIYAPDKITKDHNDSARAVIELFNEFHILKDGALRTSAQTIYELYETLRPAKSKPKQWDALVRLLQHPWFARVWVVQEVALSQRVFVKYGDETIDWDILAEALGLLNRSRNFRLWLEWTHDVHLRHIQNTSMYNVIRIDKLRESLNPRREYDSVKWPSISQLLSESFYFNATNPRDQIFGLMGLCQEPLDVDYNVSVEDTFINAAKILIKQGSVSMLFHAGGVGNRPQATPGLPTWVPDWRAAPQYDKLPYNNPSKDQEFGKHRLREEGPSAGRPQKSHLEEPLDVTLKDNKTLSLTVLYIDVIIEVGPVIFDTLATNEGTLEEMHQISRRWNDTLKMVTLSKHIASNVYPHDASGQSVTEAFHRTVLGGRQSFGWRESSQQYLQKLVEWEALLSEFQQDPLAIARSKGKSIYNLLESMDEITGQVESCCGGRRVFVTQKGYIGLCPPYAQKGDEVHSVNGMQVSVLLRRLNMGPLEVGEDYDPNGQYQLVGEGYCHGVTNRERGPAKIPRRCVDIV